MNAVRVAAIPTAMVVLMGSMASANTPELSSIHRRNTWRFFGFIFHEFTLLMKVNATAHCVCAKKDDKQAQK